MNRFPKIDRDKKDAGQAQMEQPKPLRQFEQGPPQKMPSPLWTKLTLISYMLIPLLILISIIAGGIAIAIKLQFNDGTRTGNTASQSEESTDNEKFLKTYLETCGGREALQSIHSMQTSGRLNDGETIWAIEITKKNPNSASFLLKHENTPDHRYEIEGDTVKHLSVPAEESEGSNTLLSQESVYSMIPYSRILDPLCEAALGGDATILSRSEFSNNGREMIQLELQRPDETLVYCKLDRETNYLQSIDETVVHDGARFIRRVEFDDYRMVSGVILPFRLKVFHYGLLKTELLVDSIRINQQ